MFMFVLKLDFCIKKKVKHKLTLMLHLKVT
nr:MAG TPA: hypothetical protein [Crassvirales sp.]